MSPAFRAGFRRLADPKISVASMASILLGAAAAAHDGPLAPAWLALTVLGIFAIEVGRSAAAEAFDASGPPPSTRDQTTQLACVGYLTGVAAGLAIAALREPRVLWLGLAGVAFTYFQHAPPLRLAARGLREVSMAVVAGPLVACGTYLVQRGAVTPRLVWLSLPLGLLIGAFLRINQFSGARAHRAKT